jgi:small basic protein
LQTLVTIHSWTRWLVLVALLAGIAVGVLRYRAGREWSPYIYQPVVMVVDIQVAIGAVIWSFYDGWNRGFFFAVLHPMTMLLALAVAHVGYAIANKRDDARSWLIAGGASLVSLALIIGAIPWDRL